MQAGLSCHTRDTSDMQTSGQLKVGNYFDHRNHFLKYIFHILRASACGNADT